MEHSQFILELLITEYISLLMLVNFDWKQDSTFSFQVLAAVSHAQRVCGGATVTRPVSSIAPTVIRAWGKAEHVCVVRATGELPVRTVSVFIGQLTHNTNLIRRNPELCLIDCVTSALVYSLSLCLAECRVGMYGDQCSMSCPSCSQSYRCHHVTGECDCLPGHTGPNCDQGWHLTPIIIKPCTN